MIYDKPYFTQDISYCISKNSKKNSRYFTRKPNFQLRLVLKEIAKTVFDYVSRTEKSYKLHKWNNVS